MWRWLRGLLAWPFTSTAREEALVDRLNLWFGGVPGIKQIAIVIVVYPLAQVLLPPRWRWDPYPFVFLVLLITIVSLTSNQWLMNATFRASRLTDDDRAAIRKNTEASLHMMEAQLRMADAMQELLESVEERVRRIEPTVADIAEAIGATEEVEGDEDDSA